MCRVSAKDKQNICLNNNQSKSTIEKNELENVNQNLNNLDINSTDRKDYNFLKLCRKTSEKNYEFLKKFNDGVKGLNLFVFLFYS